MNLRNLFKKKPTYLISVEHDQIEIKNIVYIGFTCQTDKDNFILLEFVYSLN